MRWRRIVKIAFAKARQALLEWTKIRHRAWLPGGLLGIGIGLPKHHYALANILVSESSFGAGQLNSAASDLVCAIVLGLELAFQVDVRDICFSWIAFVIIHFVLHVGSRSRACIGMGLPS